MLGISTAAWTSDCLMRHLLAAARRGRSIAGLTRRAALWLSIWQRAFEVTTVYTMQPDSPGLYSRKGCNEHLDKLPGQMLSVHGRLALGKLIRKRKT